ncbi:NUDIX domain-containing protein [Methanomassiliicoccus luminyensis]|uniref:NUDIX domain-containing protein n=2 Tax=Methanomassiliicoccus luminyensis TaxID=1080712 RepID=UPI000AE00537|nr:NUDIX hydrolase [Methanomassiliicoccus luminyensis]
MSLITLIPNVPFFAEGPLPLPTTISQRSIIAFPMASDSAPQYRNPKLTTDGIVVIDGKIVLIRRGREPGKGKYALPGGFVEYGERTEDSAVREVREETGLETAVLGLLGIYSDPSRDPRGHIISAVYVLRLIGGEPRAGDDAEGVELFPLDKLPELAFDHAKIIGDYLSTRSRKDY